MGQQDPTSKKNVSLEADHEKIAAPPHSWTGGIDFNIG